VARYRRAGFEREAARRRNGLSGESTMKDTYLEVTYRKGRPLAAYYYLPRSDGDRSARTERAAGGLLVDYTADGRPIGIEIVSPGSLQLSDLNGLLERLGFAPVAREDLAPLVAA
jgi:hypothetical protein